MNAFFKKMCILKQMKSGYSADGRPLSGLVKAEEYGNVLKAEVSLINFAPLSEGNYCCVISDKKGRTISFPLTYGGGTFSSSSEVDISLGFLAVVCCVDNYDYDAVAYGVNGENVYEVGSLLLRLFGIKNKNSFSSVKAEKNALSDTEKEDNKEIKEVKNEKKTEKEEYDDEKVADKDYYSFSRSLGEEDNLQSTSLLRAFKISNGDTYYRSVQSELDEIFNENPPDNSLKNAFPHSVWARAGGTRDSLVGIILDGIVVRYVCYAEFADGRESKKVRENGCFVPVSFYKNNNSGYYVLFRDADTGAYVKISEN